MFIFAISNSIVNNDNVYIMNVTVTVTENV